MAEPRNVEFNLFETVECAHDFPPGDLVEVPCNLCGSDTPRKLFQEGAFEIRECKNCGMVYVAPQPTPQALRNYYDTFYTSTSATAIESWTHPASFGQARRLIEKFGPADGKLVDVGCGMGLFLQSLGQRWQLTGIEPNANACARAKTAVPSADIINGEILSSPIPAESFDIATSLASLEHMADPSAVLRRIAEILKPGGLLIVRVPYLGGYLKIKQYLDAIPIQFGAPRHLFDFSPRSLRGILERNGFTVARTFVGSRETTMRSAVAAVQLAVKTVSKTMYYATGGTFILPFCGSIVAVAYRSTKPVHVQ